MTGPVISVLVINRDRRALLDECLVSIEIALAGLDRDAEVIVFDNGSRDGSVEMIRAHHPRVRLIELAVNEGFAPAVVRGTALAGGEWLALVNNDARLEPAALAAMLMAGESDRSVGLVTAQVRFVDRPDTINSAGLEIDSLAIAYDRLAGRPVAEAGTEAVEVFGASACVALYRMRMLDEIGGFDPSFFAFLEDADVSWRARMAGWRCLYEPRAVAYHHGSGTVGERSRRKYELVGRNRVRLIAKHATTGQLVRWGWAMVLYDLAYVSLVAVTDRTFAPLHGRVAGLREWRSLRSAGAGQRRPVELAGVRGVRGSWRMRSAYAHRASAE
jgi:GT2 family glycosyltransferase